MINPSNYLIILGKHFLTNALFVILLLSPCDLHANTGIPGSVATRSHENRNKAFAVHNTKLSQKSQAPVKIFYGGNSGTCEGFAQNIEMALSNCGVASEIASLDSATDDLSTETVNLNITVSYEGQPPIMLGSLWVGWKA
mgnify:CR=1 FL=1